MQLYPLATLLSIFYQIKLTRSHWRSCFPFLLPQYWSVYFISFVTTNDSLSIWIHHITKTVHELVWELKLILIRSPTWFRKQHYWDITCPGIPYTVPEILSSLSLGHLKWYRYSTVCKAVYNLKSSKCSLGISVEGTTMFFKFLYSFKKISVIKLLVSRKPLRNST